MPVRRSVMEKREQGQEVSPNEEVGIRTPVVMAGDLPRNPADLRGKKAESDEEPEDNVIDVALSVGYTESKPTSAPVTELDAAITVLVERHGASGVMIALAGCLEGNENG